VARAWHAAERVNATVHLSIVVMLAPIVGEFFECRREDRRQVVVIGARGLC
jgi:hypothetical protein